VGKLIKANANAREFVTESFDKARWWSTLSLIVDFLRSKSVERVRLHYRFVLDRDLDGKPQVQDYVVQLDDLEGVIKKGLDECTIEWNKMSDFTFRPLNADLIFMLCNDADLHFASPDTLLLMDLGQKISASGVKVYDSGKLI
jgi:hypothetical protein